MPFIRPIQRSTARLAALAATSLLLGAVQVQSQTTSYNDFQVGPGRGTQNFSFPWGGAGDTYWTHFANGNDPLITWTQGDNAVLGVPGGGNDPFTTTLAGSPISVGSLSVESGTWTVDIGGNAFSLNATSSVTSVKLSLASGGSLSLLGSSMSASFGTLAHSDGSINFGSGSGNTLSFTGAAGTWTGTLNILNYVSGSNTLRFGTSGSALDGAQLASISFNGVGAQIDSTGFVTPVPEPAAYAALLGAAACAAAGWKRSRRVVRS